MHTDGPPDGSAQTGLRTKTSLIRAVTGPDAGTRWDEFDEIYRPVMLALARKAGLAPHDSEDVVQNSMVTFFRGSSRFRIREQTGSFRDYLKKVVSSRVRDFLRTKRRQPAIPPTEGTSPENDAALASLVAPSESPEAEFSETIERAMLSLAKKLEPRDVQLLDLYYCKQWPAKRVAASLHMKVAHVHQVAKRRKLQLVQEVNRAR